VSASKRCHFIVVRCSYMRTTPTPRSAAKRRVIACTLSRWMSLRGTEGSPLLPITASAPGALPVRSWTCSRQSKRRALCVLHMQAHALSFDRLFVECDGVHDRIPMARNIQFGRQVEEFRFVYATFVEIIGARSTRRDNWEAFIPILRRFPAKKKTWNQLGA
jgi:hypothetical protein